MKDPIHNHMRWSLIGRCLPFSHYAHSRAEPGARHQAVHWQPSAGHARLRGARGDPAAGLRQAGRLVGHGHHPLRVPGGRRPVLWRHAGGAIRAHAERWDRWLAWGTLTQSPSSSWSSCSSISSLSLPPPSSLPSPSSYFLLFEASVCFLCFRQVTWSGRRATRRRPKMRRTWWRACWSKIPGWGWVPAVSTNNNYDNHHHHHHRTNTTTTTDRQQARRLLSVASVRLLSALISACFHFRGDRSEGAPLFSEPGLDCTVEAESWVHPTTGRRRRHELLRQ